MLRIMRFMLIIVMLGIPVSAMEFSVEPSEPRPGEVLRVEIRGIDNPARAVCRFDGRSFPLYPTARGRLRCLVGLSARLEPKVYELVLARRRFLLPDETVTLEVNVTRHKFRHRRIRMPKEKTNLTKAPGAKRARKLISKNLRVESRRQLWKGSFRKPARGRRTSEYGQTRTINKNMSWGWHRGIDIAAKSGRKVHAPNNGKVLLTGKFPLQGGTVILDHGQGLVSIFMHLKSFATRIGERVEKGAHIADVGGSGFSTGSHLHWGVYVHGTPVDPELLYKREL